MRINGIKRITGIAVMAGLAVAMVGSDAMAWSHGSWGSWGSHGSSASYGSYGSYGRVGLFGRIRARRAYRRAARASYGSYGSYGSHGSYGSYGSHGSYGGGSYRSTPYISAESVHISSKTGSGTIKVALPENAKVFVNDSPTTSSGPERSYVSRGLREGMSYSYKIRVQYEDADGEAVVENKLVKLTAGEVVSLAFGQGVDEATATAAEPVKTRLKVKVPEDAKVFMSGVPTKQTGELRTYSTTELASGEVWDGYTVRVELVRDGQTIVREQELKIEGGESYELAFSFDSAATAQLAQLGK